MKFPITKKSFERFWLYDWVAVILTVILVFTGMSFLYEMTYPKLTDEEELSIVIATYLSTSDNLEDMCQEAMTVIEESGHKGELKNVSYTFIYINKNDSSTSSLRTAQIANKIIEKSDIFILADIPTDEDVTSVNSYSDSYQYWAKNSFETIDELMIWGDANAVDVTQSLRQSFSANEGLLKQFPIYQATGDNKHDIVEPSAGRAIDLDKLNRGEIRKCFSNLFDTSIPNSYNNAPLSLLMGHRKYTPNKAQVLVFYDWFVQKYA